jgi:hypothetical protein
MTPVDSDDLVERVEAAAEVFVYGYPLVYSLRETAGFAEGHSSLPVSAPWNEFGYARELLGPETTFVSPNNDTLYVVAALDLRPGPLVLHVPDTADRYYVLQFVDAWTNNFAYIGAGRPEPLSGSSCSSIRMTRPMRRRAYRSCARPPASRRSSGACRSTGPRTFRRCTCCRTSSR